VPGRWEAVVACGRPVIHDPPGIDGGKVKNRYGPAGCLHLLATMACLVAGASPATSGPIGFDDVTMPAGIGVNATESFGASWGNFNGDIYPDLYADNHREFGRLWRNNGDGTFTDVSSAADVSKVFGPLSKANQDTHGSAFADWDNDGDQDLAQTVSTKAGYYLVSDGAGQLVDRRVTLGLTLQHDNGSRLPVFFDANNDGRLDVKVVGTRESKSNFFRQNSDGTFTLVTDSAGLTCPTATEWAQLADLDATGTLELLCGGAAFPTNVVNFVSGKGVKMSFPVTKATHDAITGDFDNDQRTDIMYVRGGFNLNGVVQPRPNIAEAHMDMTGNQSRTVTVQTAGSLSLSLNSQNWNFVIRAGGTNNGVYIGASGYHPDSLNLNLPPTGANLGVKSPGNTPGMFIGYVNGAWSITLRSLSGFSNAYLVIESSDIITGTSFAPVLTGDAPIAPKLTLNTPGGFVDVTATSGLTAERCVTGFAADLDNDMDLDVFLGCRAGASNIANVVFENLGGGKFQKVLNHGAEGWVGSAITDQAGTTESAISADYDADGFVDVFVTNGLNLVPQRTGGQVQLFRNRGNGNHWLELDLQGVASNRDGVGAKVYVTAGGVVQYREQNGGYHRWSQNYSRIHVGLAGNTAADIEIQWPSGRLDSYTAVAANAIYRAVEGQSLDLLLDRAAQAAR
jgi:hypothetical protein